MVFDQRSDKVKKYDISLKLAIELFDIDGKSNQVMTQLEAC